VRWIRACRSAGPAPKRIPRARAGVEHLRGELVERRARRGGDGFDARGERGVLVSLRGAVFAAGPRSRSGDELQETPGGGAARIDRLAPPGHEWP